MSGPFDIGQIRNVHSRFIRSHSLMVDGALEWAGDFAEKHVHDLSDFKRQSDDDSLKDATRHTVVRLSSGAVVRISSPKKYARAIEDGAKPHIIRAHGRALRFTVNGQTMFRKVVHHPGNKPFRFLRNATSAAGEALEWKLAQDMARVAARF